MLTPSIVFSIANMLVLPMWLLLIIAPKWKITRFLTDYKVIPLLLAVTYGFYVITGLLKTGLPDFSDLKSVMELFTEEKAVLTGWIHYLAFDLLVGMWIVNENRTLGIHKGIMVPCLLGTFMFGPLGFLLFMLIKFFKTKKS
jgi:hypothetical protein